MELGESFIIYGIFFCLVIFKVDNILIKVSVCFFVRYEISFYVFCGEYFYCLFIYVCFISNIFWWVVNIGNYLIVLIFFVFLFYVCC